LNVHVRLVGILWLITGVALGAESIWGLVTEEHWQSVVISWLIVLAFAILAVVSGVSFGRTGIIGRVLITIVSILALLYSLAWLLLGGVEDASSYSPVIIGLVALSIYALFACRVGARAA
jgi:lipopolysaccharide export LptBFGC system permease protein LptF